jgi:hypothetical protein
MGPRRRPPLLVPDVLACIEPPRVGPRLGLATLWPVVGLVGLSAVLLAAALGLDVASALALR